MRLTPLQVTSTLVMDALYAGCKQLEEATQLKCAIGGAAALAAGASTQVVHIDAANNTFYLEGDALQVWNRAASDSMQPLGKGKVRSRCRCR